MLNLTWEVIPKQPPKIIKKCPRCNHQYFICSEKFRMNSNKKSTDIWLIYRCEECNYTWNMDIITRKTAREIDQNLFDRCERNDVELAWHYAFDKDTLAKNRARADFVIEFEIAGELQELLSKTDSLCQINFHSSYSLGISIKKIIRAKFDISISKLDNLYQENIISIVSPDHIDLSNNLGEGCIIQIDMNKLRESMFLK